MFLLQFVNILETRLFLSYLMIVSRKTWFVFAASPSPSAKSINGRLSWSDDFQALQQYFRGFRTQIPAGGYQKKPSEESSLNGCYG